MVALSMTLPDGLRNHCTAIKRTMLIAQEAGTTARMSPASPAWEELAAYARSASMRFTRSAMTLAKGVTPMPAPTSSSTSNCWE